MSPRIIICDDVFVNARLIEDVLRDTGYSNLVAFLNPTEVVKAVYGGDIPELVITDFSMPEIDGVSLLCTLSTMVSELSGIIVSAEADSVLKKSRDYPVIDKSDPCFVEVLLNHVESSLKGCLQ
ncbi:MAG: response regulator [Candidatus Latescibacteria bacterium]|nr:response regulator [Candidatus Latescibacterota bacterium]